MPRLIDADDLYRKVVGYNGGAVDKTVAKRLIEQQPTIQRNSTQSNASNTLNALNALDTIYRQAAIDAVTDELDMIDHAPQWVFDRLEGRLKQLSSAQPERKMGKWIKGGEQPYFRKHFDIVVCSKCNKRGEHRWNFCPNCGADMRGDKDERMDV